MSLLDLIFKWFGRPEKGAPRERGSGEYDPADDDAAVAVLDPPADLAAARGEAVGGDDDDVDDGDADCDSGADAAQAAAAPQVDPLVAQYPDAWWLPKGELVTTTQRSSFRQTEMDGNLYEALVAVLRDPALELPRMSHVAQRGLQLLSNVDVDFGRLARIFATDPAIAAEILKVANSPLYRGVREINRLDLAIALDCTASMTGELLDAQGGIDELMVFVGDVLVSVRVAIVAYRDKRDDFEVRWWDFSSDVDVAISSRRSTASFGRSSAIIISRMASAPIMAVNESSPYSSWARRYSSSERS